MIKLEQEAIDALVTAMTPVLTRVVNDAVAALKADIETKIDAAKADLKSEVTGVPSQAAGLIGQLIAQIPGVGPIESLLKSIGL